MKARLLEWLIALQMLTAMGWAGVDEGVRAMQTRDYKTAYKEFLLLADAGDDKAMVTLGQMYYEGIGMDRDYAKAMNWWVKAYEVDNDDAFANIGVLYRDGAGVASNKCMAYSIFLITHMAGLGTEDTQLRVNRCLRRIIPTMSQDDLIESLNYTARYIDAYILSKGTLKGIPDEFRPSADNPALKDFPWWLDGELDFLPEDQRPKPVKREPLRFYTLTYQIKGNATVLTNASISEICDQGMGRGRLDNVISTQGVKIVCQGTMRITRNQWRYLAIEREGYPLHVFTIDHPVQPEPCAWGDWRKPDFLEPSGDAVFGLLGGRKSKGATTNLPPDACLMRFRVEGDAK